MSTTPNGTRPPPPNRLRPDAPVMAMAEAGTAGTRTALIATPGWGKTTIGALGEKPVFILTPNEQGYLTLLRRGRVPQLPIIQAKNWLGLLNAVESIAINPQDRKTLVIDALAGTEALCAQHVCETQYGGDWGERGFMAFYRGPAQVGREWPAILPRLAACAAKGMDVLLLGHAKTKRFSNPTGADYDRYEGDVGSDEVWSRIKMWAEAVLFGSNEPIVEQSRPESNVAKARGKAIGHSRILRCEYSAVADAKNTYGLAAEYTMANDPAQCAGEFWGLVKGTNVTA
jgi:hypothetical protein